MRDMTVSAVDAVMSDIGGSFFGEFLSIEMAAETEIDLGIGQKR